MRKGRLCANARAKLSAWLSPSPPLPQKCLSDCIFRQKCQTRTPIRCRITESKEMAVPPGRTILFIVLRVIISTETKTR